MVPPIAVQLYSVRDQLADDFYGTINTIGETGFYGVEPWAGLFEHISTKDAAKVFMDLGLEVISTHSPLPLGETQSEVLETLDTLQCKHLVSPWMDPKNYTSEENIAKVANTFNDAQKVAADHGIKFSIHNHAFEFELVKGQPAYKILLKYLNPEVMFQIDTYWVKTAGIDPSKVVKELGPRAPLLHIKDGPATKQDPMTAVGQGIMDVPGIIAAGSPNTEWHIVELDRCATDMITAIKESYNYLTLNGFSKGKK